MEYFQSESKKTTKQRSSTQYLVLNLPVVLLAALAVIPVHFYSVLPHQQQVLHKGLKVQLAQDHTLQLATSCRTTYINNTGLHLFLKA